MRKRNPLQKYRVSADVTGKVSDGGTVPPLQDRVRIFCWKKYEIQQALIGHGDDRRRFLLNILYFVCIISIQAPFFWVFFDIFPYPQIISFVSYNMIKE